MSPHRIRNRICTLAALVLLRAVEAHAEGCPTARDAIATDRPDVTNSSLVVPFGSLQNENGVNFSMRDDGRLVDGTNSRWRLGVAPCLEILVDLPAYVSRLQGSTNSGFTDLSPAEVADQSAAGQVRHFRCSRRGIAYRCR